MARNKIAPIIGSWLPMPEIDRAIERAKKVRRGPLVTEVEYKAGPELDLLILKLSDGHRHVIPREELQGLQSATKEQIARWKFSVVEPGSIGRLSTLTFTFPACFGASMATKKWMAEIGRSGGSVRSATKKRAARVNGLKGGKAAAEEVAAGD